MATSFLNKRDRKVLIYTLKTEIDDFKHLSTKFYAVFIDFADAFGSMKHDFIFQILTLVTYTYVVLLKIRIAIHVSKLSLVICCQINSASLVVQKLEIR